MPTENNDKETPLLYVDEQINLKTRKNKIQIPVKIPIYMKI